MRLAFALCLIGSAAVAQGEPVVVIRTDGGEVTAAADGIGAVAVSRPGLRGDTVIFTLGPKEDAALAALVEASPGRLFEVLLCGDVVAQVRPDTLQTDRRILLRDLDDARVARYMDVLQGESPCP